MPTSEIGHYRILERIGGGSLGDLYRARDTRAGRTVALRAIAPAISADPAALERFVRDARASAAVSHPNIGAIYDVVEDEGGVYVASEFVAGQTLRALIGGQPLNPRRAVGLAAQIGDALASADAVDLVHGDLRADTIVVNANGKVKLLDFGLAHWTSSDGPIGRTHGDDLLALGRVLHEMLTGQPPAGATSGSPGVDARVPRDVTAVLRRMCAADERERYVSAAAVAADLRETAARLDDRSEASVDLHRVANGRRRSNARSASIWAAAAIATATLGWLVWIAARAR